MRESTRDFLWERLTSRKLHVMIVGFVTATVFLYHGMITPKIWSTFVQYTFAIYVAGNTFEHFANQGIKLGTPKSPTKSQRRQREQEMNEENQKQKENRRRRPRGARMYEEESDEQQNDQ